MWEGIKYGIIWKNRSQLRITGQMKAQPEKWTWEVEAFWMHTWRGESAEYCGTKLCVCTCIVRKREDDSKRYTDRRSVPVWSQVAILAWCEAVFHQYLLVLCYGCSYQLNWAGLVFVLRTGTMSPYLHYARSRLTCNHKLSSPLSFSIETFIKASVRQENTISPLHYPCWGEH